MYKAKFEDGEWLIVDLDTDDVVDSGDSRRDAVLKAARMNKDSGVEDTGVTTHRGSSYGNTPSGDDDLVFEGAEGTKQWKVVFKRDQKGFSSGAMGSHSHLKREVVIDVPANEESFNVIKSHAKEGEFISSAVLLEPTSKDDQSARTVEAGKKLLGRKLDLSNETTNESIEEFGGEDDNYSVSEDRMGNVTISYTQHGNTKSVYLQGDEATDFRRQMNRLRTNKVSEDKIIHFLSQYDDVMQESNIQEAGRKPQEADPDGARELFLYATNDGDLYRQSALPIIANLQRKVKKGVYDAELAIKLWRYHADKAAQKYNKEFGGTFTPATRDLAAKELRDYYDEDVQSVVKESDEEINELSKDTLGRYVKAAAYDNSMASFKQGVSVGDAGKYHKRPDKVSAETNAKRALKREIGINKAVNHLTKESVELVEGKLKQLKDKFIELKVKAKDIKDPKVTSQLDKIRDQIKAEEKKLKDQFIELKKEKEQTPAIKAKLQKLRDQLKESYCETLEEAISNIKFLEG